MHVKSLRRIVLMVVAMVASSLSLVAVSTAPANAAAYSSFAELENNYSSVRYGVAVTLTGRVGYDTAAPKYVNAGTATLQRLPYGASSWANVSSKTYTDTTTDLVWSLKPSNTTQYRIVYSGGTYGADTYGTSVSNVVKVGVKRNLGDNFNRSTRVFYGKVTPELRPPHGVHPEVDLRQPDQLVVHLEPLQDAHDLVDRRLVDQAARLLAQDALPRPGEGEQRLHRRLLELLRDHVLVLTGRTWPPEGQADSSKPAAGGLVPCSRFRVSTSSLTASTKRTVLSPTPLSSK